MKKVKNQIVASMIGTSLLVGASVAPVQKANAGVIIAFTSILTLQPAGFILGGMFILLGGMTGRKGPYLLDVSREGVQASISQRFPGLDSALVDELATLVLDKANTLNLSESQVTEIVFDQKEIAPITDALKLMGQESLAAEIEQTLTSSVLSSVK